MPHALTLPVSLNLTRLDRSHSAPGHGYRWEQLEMEDAVTHGSIIFHLLQLQLVDFLGWLGTRVSDIGRIQNAFKMIPFAIANGLRAWYGKERMVDRRKTSDLHDVSCVTGREFSKLPASRSIPKVVNYNTRNRQKRDYHHIFITYCNY